MLKCYAAAILIVLSIGASAQTKTLPVDHEGSKRVKPKALAKPLTSKTGSITINAPCDPQHPKYAAVQANATVACISATSEDPINNPGRAYVECFPSCGGPWTLAPGESQSTTKAGTLYIVGNGKGTPNTCGATVSITDAVLPGPPPPDGPYIPGRIVGRDVTVKAGVDVSSQILAVAYMCHGHNFVPENILVYFDHWELGWLGPAVGNGLSYYGSHIYTTPGVYTAYLRMDALCPNGENNGYDAAKGEATVTVTP
jgi:hypothetical protein